MVPRWYYVENFAFELPFWDQWDAEWAGLLKPWIEGKLQLSDFFIPHNEHRIFPTRLTTLLLFVITGSWNNLTEARLNIPLSALTPVILIGILLKKRVIFGVRWLVVVVIIAGYTLPFSWENILIGFQSQFYFLNLFTLCGLALAVYWPEQYMAFLAVIIFCLLSILTSASGLLTSLAVSVVYALGCFGKQKLSIATCLVIMILILLSFGAYCTMPIVAGHSRLHADNLAEFITAALRIMGWPLRGSQLYIGLMWLPTLITIPILIIRRKITKIDLLMTGCFVWTGMQIAALAYGRGHETLHMPSRYSEVLLLGLAGNSWFVLRLPDFFESSHKGRRVSWLLVTTFFLAILISFIQRTKGDIQTLNQERTHRITQTSNVSGYLKTRDAVFLDKQGFALPYPNPSQLKQFLDDPLLQKILIIELDASVKEDVKN